MKIAVIVCGLVMLGGCGQKPEQKAPGMPGAGVPPEVAVVVVKEERVAITRELPGRVSANLVAEVRPQVSGIIRERLFEEGSSVTAVITVLIPSHNYRNKRMPFPPLDRSHEAMYFIPALDIQSISLFFFHLVVLIIN